MQFLRLLLEDGICKGNQFLLYFVVSDEMYILNVIEEKLLVICYEENFKVVFFNWSIYQKYLKIKVLGKVVFYIDVIIFI